jgi:hypothetical protein
MGIVVEVIRFVASVLFLQPNVSTIIFALDIGVSFCHICENFMCISSKMEI